MICFETIDDCTMYRYCLACDGDLSQLIKVADPSKDVDNTDELLTVFEKLSNSFAEQTKTVNTTYIRDISLNIEIKKHELTIYENCISVLSYMESEPLRAILNESDYNINLPEFGTNNYAKEIETAYNRLGKLRNLIRRKYDELQLFMKANGIEENDNTSMVENFFKMMQAISTWQGFRDNSKTISMREYAIAYNAFNDYVKSQKKNG